MKVDSRSLLSFLDTPVVVGDPEGRAVYANPAFLSRFAPREDRVTGVPLSAYFGGGGREAVLKAVAEVCRAGRPLRFRVREGQAGYVALASPITAEGTQVGVLLLLTEEVVGEERLLTFHREIQDPLSQVEHCLAALLEQTGGRRAERYRSLLEDGMRALQRLRKWSDELFALAAGSPVERRGSDAAPLDPLRSVQAAVASVQRDLGGAGVRLELLLPAHLPRVCSDAERVETALVRLLRDRIDAAQPGTTLTLAAKAVGSGEGASVLVSLVEPPGPPLSGGGGVEAVDFLRDLVGSFGGSLRTTDDPVAGRMTAILLPTA